MMSQIAMTMPAIEGPERTTTSSVWTGCWYPHLDGRKHVHNGRSVDGGPRHRSRPSGDAVDQAIVQAVPLSVNAVGRGFVPVCEALNPKFTDAPAAIVPFQDSLVMVTVVPVCPPRADQTWVTCWPPVNVQTSDQLLIVVVPVFFT